MSNDNNINSDIVASAFYSDGFDFTSEPLIPTQIINPEIPSIPSMPNRIISTSAEITKNDHDVTADYLTIFIDAPVKYGTAKCHNTALRHANKSNDNELTQPKKKCCCTPRYCGP